MKAKAIMTENFPEQADVIVIGTGLCETMVAAAISRIGKKVIHIDRNNYYSSQWSTFSFDGLQKWANSHQNNHKVTENSMKIPIFEGGIISNIFIHSCIPEKNDENCDMKSNLYGKFEKETLEKESEKSTEEKLDGANESLVETKLDSILNSDDTCPTNATNTHNVIKEKSSSSMLSQAKIRKGECITLDDFHMLSHKFNLDISFKLLYSAGPLVNTIIKANISHYVDFKVVNRVLVFKENAIVEVPCNRSDVFSSPFLSVIEKRLLMKFLTFCIECELEESACEDYKLPFIDFLKTKRLSESLQTFIIYSIAMVKPEVKALYALKEIKGFLLSLGKYGKSPFIWPLFGIGELPQAFSRMCAVFGGIYCLNKNAEEIRVDFQANKCTGLIVDQKLVSCEHIVMEKSYLPGFYKSINQAESVSRAILITNKSLVSSDEECLTFMTIPPMDGKNNLVRVLELGPASCACPVGLFVIYLACKQYQTAKEDLEDYTKLLTENSNLCSTDIETHARPRLLWSLYFNQSSDCFYENLPNNLFVGSMPGADLGFKSTVERAEIIFNSIAPNEKFMIPVPNPEDILWGEHDDASNKEDGNGNITESNNEI